MSGQPPDCDLCRGGTPEDVPLGLATSLCCAEHVEVVLQAAAEGSLRRVIPERHQPAREVPEVLRQWRGEGGQGAFLYGAVGTGKSWAAAALMKRAWLRHYRDTGTAPTMVWANVATLMDDLRVSMRSGKGDPLLPARQAWLLVLDDLGAERPTQWTAERLYVLLNDRYERLRPTVVTSNYDVGELVGRMTPTDDPDSTRGKQIVSRLVGCAVQVPFNGGDRRVP